MAISILFAALFLLCLAGMIFYPKTEKKINGWKAAVMGTMAVFCYLALAAFFYDKIGIRVGLLSLAVSLAIADIAFLAGMIWKKKVQKVFWRFSDLVCMIGLAVLVLWVSDHLFTGELRLSYMNTDPANHFRKAMRILDTGKLEGIYFASLIDELFIEAASPLLERVFYYKAFILADICMHILEIWMIYMLILTVSEKKPVRILAPIFAAGYFWGYPAYSYMTGGFVHWGIGVMILIFLVYALLLFERQRELRGLLSVLLVLGAYANSCCNKLFVPVNYLAFFVVLFYFLGRERRNVRHLRYFWAVAAGVAVAAAGAAIFFLNYWGGSVDRMFAYVQVDGAMYRSMYADLIFFLPALFYVFYMAFRKKECSCIPGLMSICMILCAIAMYILFYNGKMSGYYYYKIYYNLWLSGWILAVQALDVLTEQKQLVVFFSYAGLMVMIGWITFSSYDRVMWVHNPHYTGSYGTQIVFTLYRYNMDTMAEDFEQYRISDKMLDVFNYVLETTEGREVPLLSDDQRHLYWYNGMVPINISKYRADEQDLMELLRRMEKRDVREAVVIKSGAFYERYKDYFSLCTVVYENEEAALLTCPGKSWLDVAHAVESAGEKEELFSYVKKHLKGEKVPLMADQTSYMDFILYEKKTGQKSEDFYIWKIDGGDIVKNLDEKNISYITVLKEDLYYINTQEYYDVQDVVFENEAGKVLKSVGDTWEMDYGEVIRLKEEKEKAFQ